ncbi:hypothetical protein [Niallia taxi]|uniref:hypothetical protein n=1 Tax=Niallia taxi TaxID=2499688 RepID=UPI002E2253B3|nr:hypothetical protein [Niallia taxi]
MTTAKEKARLQAEQEALEAATAETAAPETVGNTDKAMSAASIIAVAAAAQEVEKTDDEIRKEEEVTSVIYCGPSLKNNAMRQYDIFTSDVPIHVKEHLERCPPINALMVPVGQLNQCVTNISTQGTAEQVMFEQIQAYVRGEQ